MIECTRSLQEIEARLADLTDEYTLLEAEFEQVEADNTRLREALEDCVRELTHLLNAEPSRRFGKYEAARDAGRAALATLVGEVK